MNIAVTVTTDPYTGIQPTHAEPVIDSVAFWSRFTDAQRARIADSVVAFIERKAAGNG